MYLANVSQAFESKPLLSRSKSWIYVGKLATKFLIFGEVNWLWLNFNSVMALHYGDCKASVNTLIFDSFLNIPYDSAVCI